MFQTCSLHLYKYVAYFQLILPAWEVRWKRFLNPLCIHNLFYGFCHFSSPHHCCCVCWTFWDLASQMGAFPVLCSAHCPFQCSCEPCYFWLLSYVLVWIRTLSLIPSLACLYCCSREARVIQFLGNSYYLSLWTLPILPYFRIILISVIFHWVDVLIKIILKLLLRHSNTQGNTTIYVVSLYVPESCKTCTNCDILTERVTKSRKKKQPKTFIRAKMKALELNLNNRLQISSDQTRLHKPLYYKLCSGLISLQLSGFRFLKTTWEFRHPNTIKMNSHSASFGLTVPSWCCLW